MKIIVKTWGGAVIAKYLDNEQATKCAEVNSQLLFHDLERLGLRISGFHVSSAEKILIFTERV